MTRFWSSREAEYINSLLCCLSITTAQDWKWTNTPGLIHLVHKEKILQLRLLVGQKKKLCEPQRSFLQNKGGKHSSCTSVKVWTRVWKRKFK